MAWNFKNPWAENIWASPQEQSKVLDNEWAEVDRREKKRDEEKTKKEKTIEDIRTGIFIYGLNNENQIKDFMEKIKKLVPLDLKYKYQNIGNKSRGKGVIYKNGGNIDLSNPIQKVILYALNKELRLMHDEKVNNYDKFNGNNYQYINIDQYNATYQDEFFIYALTHLIREYFWAVQLNILEDNVTKNFDKEYKKAHNKTLLQDLEIFSYIVKSRHLKKFEEILKQKYPNQSIKVEWNWWEDLNKYGYLKNESLEDGPGKTILSIVGSAQFDFFRCEVAESLDVKRYTYLSFVNIESMEKADINNPEYTYDKIEL